MGTYKGRVFIRTEIYACGDGYMDASIYPVFQPPGQRRSKCKPTSEMQARINQRHAELELTRLAHRNFAAGDIMLTLTYRNEPETVADAEKILRNFLRRVKRLRKKRGLDPLKYIYCTQRGEKYGRIHHHLMINAGIERDELERMWGQGTANARRIQYEGKFGIAGLAIYMAKGSKTRADRDTYRRYTGSRNLARPEPRVLDGKATRADLSEMADVIEGKSGEADYFEAMFPGYEYADGQAVRNSVNKGDYIHVQMWRRASMPTEGGQNR